MSREYVALVLHVTGVLFYGGPLLCFALIMPFSKKLGGLSPWHVDRVYRAMGPISGLGFGAAILGGILVFYLQNGSFTWAWGSAEQGLLFAKHMLFLALWVSYTVLEVWTLEPLRRLDDAEAPSDPTAYMSARSRVVRHVQLNAVLFLTVSLLAVFHSVLGAA